MVTLKEVAQKAGVSPSTASAALRDMDIVKPDTAKRVQDAAQKLNYRTNLSARALRSGHSGIFTLIIPDLDNDYYSKLANSLASELFVKDRKLIIQLSKYNKRKELEQLSQLTSSMCDGVFICSTKNTGKDISEAVHGHPVIMFDDMSGESDEYFDSIETPSQTGMYTAISHLVECGRKHIGVVGCFDQPQRRPSLGRTLRQNRYNFALEAIRSYGLRDEDALIEADWTIESGRKTAHDIVRRGLTFDAFCCMNDELALGVIRGLLECGVDVPPDVAVTGFDGINAGTYSTPTLTTLAVDFTGMAQTSINMMEMQIARDCERPHDVMPRRVIVGYQLLTRESTMGRITRGDRTPRRADAGSARAPGPGAASPGREESV